MKRLLSLAAVFAAIFFSAGSASAQSLAEKWDPVADEAAVVTFDNARFTVLTSRLIRMEWSEDGKFEDRASLAIVNRRLDVPEYKVIRRGGRLVIRTADLVLSYKGGKFDENNLSVSFVMGDRKVSWHPGMDDSANLLGTTRTLDGCNGLDKLNHKNEPMEQGVLSRDGWAIVDESSRHLFEAVDADWHNWVACRDGADRQDLYIFAYGHDYKAALADFTKIAGRIPLPPKYMFGYWWSRYWQYSDFEFVNLAREIRSHDIPIDVMVIDMDWHETFTLMAKDSPKDEFGQRIGWTGYSWQKQLFPNPEQFLSEIHDLGYKTSLNLHPASGIQPYEDSYERFVADYTSRTSDYDGPKDYVYGKEGWQFTGPYQRCGSEGEKAPVPFRICQMDWADAYFNSVIHPLEKQGVDFWWLDWQQWRLSRYTDNLSNTFWLNYTFFNDKVRQSVSEGRYAQRPVIYHRWGGLGSHRYQIGFSGDTYEEWSVLRFLPEFTATASNVGYGYWGHDIGGHMQKTKHPSEAEMYTRWLQYGVFTPIFKTHCTKSRWIERRIWAYPEEFPYLKAAIRLRYDLSPYIYDAARQGYDTGISMCRPLYYELPENDRSYSCKEEFFFGDNILATVLCQPADKTTGLTERQMWFPEGNDWYDMATGTIYAGGSEKLLHYTLAENPWFIKTAAIVPMAASDIKSLQEKSNVLRILVAPGQGSSSYVHYEDDGDTQAYAVEYASTLITNDCDGKRNLVKVAAREGSYRDMDAGRTLSFIFERVFAPESVTVNGKTIAYDRNPQRRLAEGKACWSYDGDNLCAIVYLPEMPATTAVEVECRYRDEDLACSGLLNGAKGLIHRMMDITPETKIVMATNVDSYMLLPVPFLKIAQAGSIITEDPFNAASHLQSIDVKAMCDAFGSFEKLPADFKLRIASLAGLE